MQVAPSFPNNDLFQNGNTAGQNSMAQQVINNYAEFEARSQQQTKRVNEGRNSSDRSSREYAVLNPNGNGDNWFGLKPSKNSSITETRVQLRPMRPFWMPVRDHGDRLLLTRLIQAQ